LKPAQLHSKKSLLTKTQDLQPTNRDLRPQLFHQLKHVAFSAGPTSPGQADAIPIPGIEKIRFSWAREQVRYKTALPSG
jgi:hypothetical protein